MFGGTMEDRTISLLNEDLQDLHEVLEKLKDYQKKQSSLRWNFWRGVFYGFGFFVGTSILVSLLVYGLNHIGADGNTWLGRVLKEVIELFQKKPLT